MLGRARDCTGLVTGAAEEPQQHISSQRSRNTSCGASFCSWVDLGRSCTGKLKLTAGSRLALAACIGLALGGWRGEQL